MPASHLQHLTMKPLDYLTAELQSCANYMLTDTDRARLFERNAAALFGLTGLQATYGQETV